MTCVIPLLLLVSSALAFPTEEKPYYDLDNALKHFNHYIEQFNKHYETNEEFEERFEIFKQHLANINHLNDIHEAVYDVNTFSDMSYEEFKQNRFGLKPSKPINDGELVKVPEEWVKGAPDSLDYRDQNMVTPAKDQKSCGSCYIFAGVGEKTLK